ncbi:hypothetical protein GCM10027049_21890 [Mucilaginibacter puniceus]
MADNNKISIDIEINASGQQQLNQYKNAFDGLRTSINNLSNPISKLDGDIVKLTESLKKTSEQNQNVESTIKRVKEGIFESIDIFDKLKEGINKLKISFGALEATFTAGLSILIAFAPEIIKWVGEVIKGDKHVSTFNQTLRDHKIVMEAVNGARLKGTQDAQQELTHLKLLYDASQNHNLKLADRKKIVTELQNQYPDYFGKQTKEAILNGKATSSYDKLTESILATSRARAAENVMVKNQEQKLGNEDKSAKLTGTLKYYEKQLAAAKKEYDKVAKQAPTPAALISGVNVQEDYAERRLQNIQQKVNTTKNLLKNLSNDSLQLDKQNKALADSITKDLQKSGAGTLGVSNGGYVGKPKKQTIPDGKPRGGVDLEEAKAPDLNINIDTNRTEEQKQQDLIALKALDPRNDPAVKKTQATQEEIDKIEEFYAKRKADREDALANAKIHAGDRFIDAALKNSKKDSAIYKAAFLAKKATSIADTIISTKRAVMESFKAYAGIPFVGQALGIIQAVFMAGQGAMSIAEIAKQKPGFARGGQFRSDGRGSLLSGYSRMDDTNAYLRSGEAVVVSEAMRNPWARNLVSAINVAYGGRDFSVTNPGRGYAIGGIFTDGGNSNRYYNQPMNDQKDLANTIAYQMINNFPPVYVDVKDINTQQNIMAQTINRVNL